LVIKEGSANLKKKLFTATSSAAHLNDNFPVLFIQKVGYMKMWIEGKLWIWDEIKDKLRE